MSTVFFVLLLVFPAAVHAATDTGGTVIGAEAPMVAVVEEPAAPIEQTPVPATPPASTQGNNPPAAETPTAETTIPPAEAAPAPVETPPAAEQAPFTEQAPTPETPPAAEPASPALAISAPTHVAGTADVLERLGNARQSAAPAPATAPEAPALATETAQSQAAPAPEVQSVQSFLKGHEVYENGQWRFLRDDGIYATGLVRLPDGRAVYYGDDYGMKTGTVMIDGMPYEFDSVNGNISRTGEIYVAGKGWAYLEPNEVTYAKGVFLLPDGRYVYYDESGIMQFGDVQVNTRTAPMRLDPVDGHIYTGELYFEGLGWTYLASANSDYCVANFNNLPDGRRVYYGSNGAMVFGQTTLYNMPYYFDAADGRLKTGEIYLDNKGWAYLSPDSVHYSTGITRLPDGRVVYYGNDRIMATGQIIVENMPYIFDNLDGRLTNYGENYVAGKGWAYLSGQTNRYVSGILQLSDGRFVLYGNDCIMMFGDAMMNGEPYRLDPVDGRIHTGEVYFADLGWTYRSPETKRAITGFFSLPDGRYVYYGNDYAMKMGAFDYTDGVYYGDASNGNILRGWWDFDDGVRYFDGTSGKMAVDWLFFDNGMWYQFDDYGRYLSETNINPSQAYDVLSYVNSYRGSNGRNLLVMDDFMMGLAMDRAQEIISKFDHTRPDGRAWNTIFNDYEYDIYWTYIGENIAAGFASPYEVMEGWMGSDGHRANIMEKQYTHIGVGVFADANGRKYWVQLFGASRK